MEYTVAAVEAFHVCPSLDILIPALREGGVEGLDARITLTPGAHSLSHPFLHYTPAQTATYRDAHCSLVRHTLLHNGCSAEHSEGSPQSTCCCRSARQCSAVQPERSTHADGC